MLLADGDNDIGFLRGMIEMYQALRYLGKDVTLLRYEGHGHGFEGPSMADFWKRENEFLDRHLKPESSSVSPLFAPSRSDSSATWSDAEKQ